MNSDVLIFDLDLTLWDGSNLYPDVKYILDYNYNRKKLFIVSYNLDPIKICEELDILQYFEGIHWGRNKKKSNMINNIISEYNYIPNKISFYDDNIINIIDVENNTGVNVFYITNGLRLVDLYR